MKISRQTRCRNGLSLLEFLGCSVAVLGGMWFGAMHLGIDVERVAYEASRDSGLTEILPEGFKPIPPEGHPDKLSEEEVETSLQGELVALRHEITALRKSNTQRRQNGSQAERAHTASDSLSAEETLEFWNHLIEIATDEAALQQQVQSALTEANADSVFALRGRVSQFAGKAVESSPNANVDPAAIQLGHQLAGWYFRGGDLYNRAAHLWSDQNAQKSSAQLTKSWETSERQLRNEAQLLSNKASSIRAALSRTYGVEFPEFGG